MNPTERLIAVDEMIAVIRTIAVDGTRAVTPFISCGFERGERVLVHPGRTQVVPGHVDFRFCPLFELHRIKSHDHTSVDVGWRPECVA